MAAAVLSALEELEQRAGASDTDRPAWLAERRRGLTATEVRDLALKGPAFKRELIEAKLADVDEPELRSPYIVWGRRREPIIAERVEAVHGLRPESRVFRAADQPRWLGSPDGVGEDFDGSLVVAEYKTAEVDIAPGTVKFDAKGYFLQMQWVMRVTGARRCLYAWEKRVGDPDYGFEPGPLRMAWVEYDEATVRRLEAIAVDFLDALDEARRAREVGEEPGIDEHADTLAVNYLHALDAEKQGTEAKRAAYGELKDYLAAGEPVSQKSTLAQITYVPEVVETVLVADEDAARAADPMDLWGDVEHLEAELKAARARWGAHCEGFLTREESRVVKKEVLRVTPGKDTRKAKA